MPIRTATLNRQIKNNGAKLHLASVARQHSRGQDQPASPREQGLLEERRALKQAQAERRAAEKLPKPKAVKVVREAKPVKAKAVKAPKEPKAAKEPKSAKAGAAKPTPAEKKVKKAANAEAAKKADKKSAKA